MTLGDQHSNAVERTSTEGEEPVDRVADRGITFVEILVTIVLMGTVVLGVLAATRASVIASRTSRDAARVESALLTAAERVERASRADATYQCDLSGPVYAAARLDLGVPEAEVATYASISYEHLTTAGWADGACPASGYQPNLVQRITITMRSPDRGVTRQLEVIKGDV